MNKELLEALNILEKENNISKDTLLEAIENSLLTACKNHFWQGRQCQGEHEPRYMRLFRLRGEGSGGGSGRPAASDQPRGSQDDGSEI